MSSTFLGLVLALLVALMDGRATHAAADPVPPRLDARAVTTFVNDYLDRHGLAGAGVAVVRDGAVVHSAGYGVTDDGLPVDEGTPMGIGSVSKSFTAFAVLQLVAAGEVHLDSPVTAYLPKLELGDDRADDITVRHLLSHTSGLPDPVIVPPAETLAEDLAHLDDWRLAWSPGERYRYSNYNYRVAARLVEVVSDTDFGAYVDREVFTPLGMDDSRAVSTRRDDPALDTGHVTAYGLSVPAPEMDVMAAGSGGVVTTADDLALWLAMQTNGGRSSDGRVLLPKKLLEQSKTRQPAAGRTGLGWRWSGPEVRPVRISHSGSLSRFNAHVDLVPSSGYAVGVMLNSFTPTREHAYEISSGIVDITEGLTPSAGVPVATLIDAALGALTVLVLAWSAVGVRRSRRWSGSRSSWPAWRYTLRLLPLLAWPALAGHVFVVLPQLQDNSATSLDALLLWPAAMVLLLTLGVAGTVLPLARILARTGLPRRGAGLQAERSCGSSGSVD